MVSPLAYDGLLGSVCEGAPMSVCPHILSLWLILSQVISGDFQQFFAMHLLSSPCSNLFIHIKCFLSKSFQLAALESYFFTIIVTKRSTLVADYITITFKITDLGSLYKQIGYGAPDTGLLIGMFSVVRKQRDYQFLVILLFYIYVYSILCLIEMYIRRHDDRSIGLLLGVEVLLVFCRRISVLRQKLEWVNFLQLCYVSVL